MNIYNVVSLLLFVYFVYIYSYTVVGIFLFTCLPFFFCSGVCCCIFVNLFTIFYAGVLLLISLLSDVKAKHEYLDLAIFVVICCSSVISSAACLEKNSPYLMRLCLLSEYSLSFMCLPMRM